MKWLLHNWPALYFISVYAIATVIGFAALQVYATFFDWGEIVNGIVGIAIGIGVCVPAALFLERHV